MSDSLPFSVAHRFSVKRIGKIYAAFCNRCSYRVNFMVFPITPSTHARLIRHVDHHDSFDDYVNRTGIEPADIQVGDEK